LGRCEWLFDGMGFAAPPEFGSQGFVVIVPWNADKLEFVVGPMDANRVVRFEVANDTTIDHHAGGGVWVL